MCAFFCLRWASECFLSSGKETIAVLLCLWVFARLVYFFKYSASSAALLLSHSFHLCSQHLKSSMFCTKHGNYFSYSLPSFFCFSPVLHMPLSAYFSFLFLCISELLTSFCFSWNKRQAEKKRGVVFALKGISMCVDLFYRVDYSLVQILGVRVREETWIPFSGMNAIVMWV